MFEQNLVSKIICAVVVFFLVQLSILWYNVERLDEKKLTIEAEIELLERKQDALRVKNWNIQRDIDRLELRYSHLQQRSSLMPFLYLYHFYMVVKTVCET